MLPTKPRLQTVAMPVPPGGPDIRQLGTIATTPPEITYEGPAAGRDPRELFSLLEPCAGGDVLDLGCGPGLHAKAARAMGLRYVGIDIDGDGPDLLADAHALPFRDGSFDAVLAYAVLEHLYNPWLALSEIARVLRPGGVWVGSVSLGEPFHASFFHHTAWGFLSLVASGPFSVRRLWSSGDTLVALARMGRYHRATRPLLRLLAWFDAMTPWLAPRTFRAPAKEQEINRLHRAASVCFHVVRD